MPDKKSKLREDANETAFRVLQEALGKAKKTVPPEDRTDEDKDPDAVERGRKGGKRGGEARREAMTDEERSDAAKLAANARWKKA